MYLSCTLVITNRLMCPMHIIIISVTSVMNVFEVFKESAITIHSFTWRIYIAPPPRNSHSVHGDKGQF